MPKTLLTPEQYLAIELVRATGLYTYPDVVVVCGERRFVDERRDILLNPSLLVASDRVHTDLHTHRPDGRWLLTSADRLEDSLDLPGSQPTRA
jgi:hypothetical protein